MTSHTGDSLAVQKAIAAVIIGAAAILLGYLLADNPVLAFLVVFGPMWLFTLPYHSELSVRIAVATFASALIVPFFPGRPYVWELAALLGWSGLVITLFLRREHPGMTGMIRSNLLIYVGVLGYCAVLLVTMYYRGFGLRVLGGEQMGGRFYIQQLVCGVFPWLLAAVPTNERTLTRLFYLQCLLTVSYLVSDLALTNPTGLFLLLLQFFELSADAVNFELQSEQFGIRRFQSLALVSGGAIYFLWARYGVKSMFSRKGVYLLPLTALALGMGLMSGHRYLIVIVVLTFFFCSYAQRLFTLQNSLILAMALLLGTTLLYPFADKLPLAAQRTVSMLPGIEVSEVASRDARGTWEVRRTLRKIGMEMAPEYRWVGRGFGIAASSDALGMRGRDVITSHVSIGQFYNGFVGLLVNTGIFGTVFMLLFLTGGTVVAWRVVRLLREHRWEDPFALVCGVIASLWLARCLGWLFLHGASEWALRHFSLQAALLVVCHFHLLRRLQTDSPSEPVPGALGRV